MPARVLAAAPSSRPYIRAPDPDVEMELRMHPISISEASDMHARGRPLSMLLFCGNGVLRAVRQLRGGAAVLTATFALLFFATASLPANAMKI